MKQYQRTLLLPLFLLCVKDISGQEMLALVDCGVPRAAVLLSPGANATEQFAASEFASYIQKITGAELTSGDQVPGDRIPIRFAVAEDGKKNLSRGGMALLPTLRDDGFLVDVTPQGVTIIGAKKRSMYFAAYHILREYGGIYWLYPGDEGEYFEKRESFSIPLGAFVKNPAFPVRYPMERGRFGTQSKLWLARNGMTFRTRSPDETYATPCGTGGHEMTRLLVGFTGLHYKTEEEFNAARDALFQQHPEYFGLRDGQRFLSGNQMPKNIPVSQPCTSNPDTILRMANHLRDKIASYRGHELIYSIMNDDHLNWCQCNNCRAIDGDTTDDINATYSNRWWNFANALTRALGSIPQGTTLEFLAYQNYRTPPTTGNIDPHLMIQFCTHGRCYIHPLEDPRCIINAGAKKLFEAFARTGNAMGTFEYPGQLPGTFLHLFYEKTWIRDLQYYHKIGMRGYGTNFYSADTDFNTLSTYSKNGQSESVNLKRYSQFLFWYLTAHFSWNIHDDVDAITEKVEKMYYGAAWPAMKEYRAWFEEAVLNAGVHMSTKLRSFALLGECIARKGGMEIPEKLLAEAEELAKQDPLTNKRIALERKFFEGEWQAAYDYYLKMDGKPEHAERRLSAINIDGILNEPDWLSARPISSFTNKSGGIEAPPSTARVVFDDDNLYFGFEAPKTEAGLDTEKLGHGTRVFQGTHVELFLTPFGATGPYYLFAFSPLNHLFQSRFAANKTSRDDSIKVNPEFKALDLKDRWMLEARIPLAGMGAKIIDGATWKFNVYHQSLTKDGKTQVASCSGGIAHGSPGHLNLIFGEITPLIRNGGFDTLEECPPEKNGGWDLPGGEIPAGWTPGKNNPGKMEILQDGEKAGNVFLRISAKNSYLSYHFIRRKGQGAPVIATYRVEGRARGQGQLRVSILGDRKHHFAPNSDIKLDAENWQNFSMVIEAPAQILYLRFTGIIDVDDIRVSPCASGEANAEIDAF